MIRLQGVTQRFGAFGLRVDLRVPAGAYLTLLGPSGCGKSLLLGTLAGLYPAASGQVLLDGEDVTALPPEARALGFVFQKSSLFPHLGVADNIAFGLKVRGVARAQRLKRVDELCELLGITALMERPTTALSGGEAQRVALARALAPSPRVLLLDEPLSLVDHNARLELQAVLKRLHAELDLTVLHVTHDREEARALGDQVAVMQDGEVVQQGPWATVTAAPANRFVAYFLGLDFPGEAEITLPT